MLMRSALLSSALAFFALAACGSDGNNGSAGDGGASSSSGGSSGGGGAAGATCNYDAPCDPSNDCIVKDQAQFVSPLKGVCQPRDASCPSGCDCRPPDCLKSGVCAQIGGKRLYGCFTVQRGENEACEKGVACKDGLFCLVPAEGQQGTCKPIPSTCTGSSLCSCLQEQCAPNGHQSCIGVADVYAITCKPPA